MYGCGVLCKRYRKSFYSRSIESLPFLAVFRTGLSKTGLPRDQKLRTWNRITKVESISPANSKCREIKHSSSTELKWYQNQFNYTRSFCLHKYLILFLSFLLFKYIYILMLRKQLLMHLIVHQIYILIYDRYVYWKMLTAMKLSWEYT